MSLEMDDNEVDAIWMGRFGWDDLKADRILSLDLGTRIGFALHVDGQLSDSGWYDTARKGGGMKMLRFKQFLVDLLKTGRPTAVFYERIPFQRGAGREVILRQCGIMEVMLEEQDTPYAEVHPATLKKFATGRGNASKDEMREALMVR